MKNNKQILIVENEVIISHHLKMEFKQEGYEIKLCSTGEKAIEMAKHNPPDVVLMDIKLAGIMDGIEAAQKIKGEHDIPLIFITGYNENELYEKAQKVDYLAYIEKPFSIKKLKAVIEKAVEKD